MRLLVAQPTAMGLHHAMPLCLPLVLLLISAHLVATQVLVNGQLFTDGLAIVDAPAPNSNYQAGSTIAIAIDVSGNGKLSQSAQVPGSSLSTRFEGLQIFLISDSSEFNMTISDGNTLLYQESGSNVKHVTWAVPSCTPSGSYNITLYESSVINNKAYYTITPIPIDMSSSSTGQCSDLNQFQSEPQPSSPSPQSPWLTSDWCSTCSTAITIPGITTTNNPASTQAQLTTVSSGLSYPTSRCSSCTTGTSVPIQNFPAITQAPVSAPLSGVQIVTAYPSHSGGTVTLTIGEPTLKITFVTVETLTISGFTTTATMTISITSELGVPTGSIDFVGYIPVDGTAEKHLWMSAVGILTAVGLSILTLVALLH